MCPVKRHLLGDHYKQNSCIVWRFMLYRCAAAEVIECMCCVEMCSAIVTSAGAHNQTVVTSLKFATVNRSRLLVTVDTRFGNY